MVALLFMPAESLANECGLMSESSCLIRDNTLHRFSPEGVIADDMQFNSGDEKINSESSGFAELTTLKPDFSVKQIFSPDGQIIQTTSVGPAEDTERASYSGKSLTVTVISGGKKKTIHAYMAGGIIKTSSDADEFEELDISFTTSTNVINIIGH